MLKKKEQANNRLRRKRRIRKKISGSTSRPRLSVFRSNRHIYAQVVDDTTGKTLASASTLDPEIRGEIAGKGKKEQAKLVGKIVGERAKSAGISEVVFDRNGYIYHGRVAAVADGAREAGVLSGGSKESEAPAQG